MPDVNSEFEKEHLRNLGEYQNQVRELYYATIDQIFRATIGVTLIKPEFRVTDYPVLNNALQRALGAFNRQLSIILVNGIRTEFDLSDRKNIALFEQTYGRPAPAYFNPNQQAYADFVARRTGPKKLNLSDRIWKLQNQFQAMIEESLYAGISKGQSAARMAAEAKQFLRQPDKLFRRVRDAKGKLVLSRPAKLYKPGAGVYRSSYRNALRLTATETNRAYRKADGERWKNTPFVLGYEIKLSNNHPKADQCDVLAGPYPVDFDWTGWHPFCICRKIPLLADKEQYSRYEDAILAGEADNFKFNGKIKDTPQQFKNYVTSNMEKIEGYKSKPYWMLENSKFVKQVMQQ